MDRKIRFYIVGGITLLVGLIALLGTNDNTNETINKLEATVIGTNEELVMIQERNNVIYTIDAEGIEACYNGNIILEYTGILDKNSNIQDVTITGCEAIIVNGDASSELVDDRGIFSKYYKLAANKVKDMTLDEKISQLLLVRYPDSNGVSLLKKHQFGGYVFYEKDFVNKNESEVKKMITDLQDVADIPLLTAVDEEGGKVVRVSSNPNLVDKPFDSPSTLYKKGGFSLIKADTINKSAILKDLGLNLNLAPVVDVATDKNAYMFDRTLQENTELTSEYARTVIEASKNTGVSYTLKHFPGYSNNTDTHIGTATDNRSYDDIYANDLPPFEAGIKAGAEAVLVSHNIVTSIDGNNPASLSPSIHNLLRNELNFTGIIISDDIGMKAVNSFNDTAVKAILAGNDMIISTNYEVDIKDIKNAISNGTLTEDMLNKLAMRVIAWKYYKGLLFKNQK